jgi:hypothetical protein
VLGAVCLTCIDPRVLLLTSDPMHPYLRHHVHRPPRVLDDIHTALPQHLKKNRWIVVRFSSSVKQ